MSHDPVRLELIKNAVGSVVDEMVLTIVRIAYSSILKDTMDLSSAFCDPQGRMIAQGLSLPLHLGSIPDAMDAVLGKYGDTLRAGDIVVLNDPYLGGMHLPDIFMFQPVFHAGVLIGYAVVVAHHNDMGGRVPGSSAADSTEIFQEGLRIPIVKLHDRGVVNETLVDMLRLNVRVPDVVLGDLDAQVAACRIAERGMQELAAKYGAEELLASFEALLDYSEREARRTIRAIPDGVWRFTDHLDDDGVRMDQPVTVQVAIHVTGDTLTIDLAGSSPQVMGAINATLSFAKSAAYFAIRAIMDWDVPNNAGFFRPIRVEAPLGCFLNPRSPGAVAARGVSGFRLIDALFGALAQAVPHRVRAAGEGGTTSYSIGGVGRDGRYALFREALMGAWGAGEGREGIDGVANPACNIGNAPIEVVESQNPVRVERYELVADSGGAGEHRGGMSVERQLRFLGETATLQLRSDRRRFPPYGLAGGQHGAPSATHLHNADGWSELPTKFTRPLRHGEALRHRTAGAGGHGDPLRRDPLLVLEDLRDGKVTPDAALRIYGVALHAQPWRVDHSATVALRAQRSRQAAGAAAPITPADAPVGGVPVAEATVAEVSAAEASTAEALAAEVPA
jgi:N-methylhydantoinase B